MSQTIRVSKAIKLFQIPRPRLFQGPSQLKPCTGSLSPETPRVWQTRLMNQRNLSSTASSRAALASSLPTQPTVVLFAPTPEYIEKEELDVELIPLEQVKLEITDRAAEQLMKITQREQNPNAALRIAVESGGCHGYQYKMDLATSRSPDDYHFSHPSIKPSNILVDAVSLSLLNGSTVDFSTELIGSSFRVAHNPQSKGSGCGCGVSWELKE